jgi:hypothetical protein
MEYPSEDPEFVRYLVETHGEEEAKEMLDFRAFVAADKELKNKVDGEEERKDIIRHREITEEIIALGTGEKPRKVVPLTPEEELMLGFYIALT